jgi:Tat protein secretion system quality control protein TatD with DNase activity
MIKKYQTYLEQSKELFKEKQRQVFIVQLEMAQELNLPLIVHTRMAFDDTYNILKSQITNHKLLITISPAKAGGNSNVNPIWDNHLNRNVALAHSNRDAFYITGL